MVDAAGEEQVALTHKEMAYSNGARYEGTVNAMNQRQGHGTLTFPNNEATYVGEFHEGQMTTGKITYHDTGNDCYFEGTFENGQWDVGIYKKGPAHYKGTFVNQQMEGHYIVTWDNGIKYDGQVVDNKLEGPGVMTFDDGNIATIDGIWTNDTLTKCNMLTMRDGSTANNYDPISGKLRGEGTVKVGASTYTGFWDEDGKLNGEGTIINDDNQGSFQGTF